MRISFLGSSLVSAYWNGACTYYRGIIRGLHDLGHDVTSSSPTPSAARGPATSPNPAGARSSSTTFPTRRR